MEKWFVAAKKADFDAWSQKFNITPVTARIIRNRDIFSEEEADKYGVKFRYVDFRPGFRESHELSRKYELYRQKYCGCIFSEHDRYKGDKKHFPDLFE